MSSIKVTYTYEAQNNDTGKEQLDNNQEAIDNAEFTDITIHARKNICGSLTDSNQDTNDYKYKTCNIQ
jgi:hypothetical protein